MNFISGLFLTFLFITLSAFYLLPKKGRLPFLLLMSYFFYATWSIPFITIIILTTTTDYWMSQIIARSSVAKTRKIALAAGLTINLLILGFFKYCNFFLETSHGLAHWLGLSLALPSALRVILPLGISFYTFEAISYMVDVYRGKLPADNWLNYNFYIMYFPHLISGPIIRFGELFSQYKSGLALPSIERIAKGCELILLGYCFKVLIADPASHLSDPVFQNPLHVSAVTSYLAALAFTVQIYFDFMGYTHIARGVSLLFNIELPLNFNHPYHATTISDFWKRWHISLSRWIQDYLYIPLGGSKGNLVQTLSNLMVTMLICGAWHGAGWTYIVWGGYHGVLLSLYHLYKNVKDKFFPEALVRLTSLPLYTACSLALTFLFTVWGWVIFRAKDFNALSLLFQHLFNIRELGEELLKMVTTGHLSNLTTALVLLVCCFIGPSAVRVLANLYRPMPFWLKVQTACLLGILCWILTAEGTAPFIYFQF